MTAPIQIRISVPGNPRARAYTATIGGKSAQENGTRNGGFRVAVRQPRMKQGPSNSLNQIPEK